MNNIIHFNDFINEGKIKKSELDIFWNKVNEVADKLKNKSDFSPYWELEEMFPQLKGIKSSIDRKLVILHNKNKISKKTSLEERIVMFLIGWYEINKHKFIHINKDNFKDWFYNGELTIYRGFPDKNYNTPNFKVDVDKYISTTLDLNTAIKFTQYGWSQRVWKDENSRNGWVLFGTIKPCDIIIYHSEGYEYECIIKGEYTFEEASEVINNEIIY